MPETIQTKDCYKCKQIKPISEFHKHKRKGFQHYCKPCQKKYNQGERNKAFQKRYRQSKEGKAANLKAFKKYQKTQKYKVATRNRSKRYKIIHPELIKANKAVSNAIRDGKLPRPDTLQCNYCPKQAEQYHHWKGYAKEHWLDVVPACRKCHRKIHRHSAAKPSGVSGFTSL